jgi:hypothetical protein
VKEQRWPWLLAAGLMLAAAVAAARSTYLYWLPCRGSMLEGTLIHPSSGDGRTYEEFTKLDPAVKAAMRACEARMDGDISEQAPWTSELLVLAMALAGLAWLTLVLGLRWQLRTKAVAALPGLAAVVMALVAAMAIGDVARGQDDPTPWDLSMTIELSALVALAAIWAWQPDVRAGRLLRLVVALWGATAFGAIHLILEYVIMIHFSERNWDDPPGTGYLTVATITISAILLVIMTLRMPRTAADGDPQPDYDSGSLTFT